MDLEGLLTGDEAGSERGLRVKHTSWCRQGPGWKPLCVHCAQRPRSPT